MLTPVEGCELNMKEPVLLVKFNRTVSGWEVLFNYDPKDAVETYKAYVNKFYPDEWDTRFKIVDLAVYDKSQLAYLPEKSPFDDED